MTFPSAYISSLWSEVLTYGTQNQCRCAATEKNSRTFDDPPPPPPLFFCLSYVLQQRKLHTQRSAVSIVADGQLQEMGH